MPHLAFALGQGPVNDTQFVKGRAEHPDNRAQAPSCEQGSFIDAVIGAFTWTISAVLACSPCSVVLYTQCMAVISR